MYRLIAGTRGCEHLVACPEEPPYYARFVSLVGAGNVYTIPHRQFSVKSVAVLRRAVRDRGIDIIHSHGLGAGLYGRLLACLSGKPSVHTYHGFHSGLGLDLGRSIRYGPK
jgi:hypothetical protein